MLVIPVVIFVFLFLVLSLPFLGIEWLIARKNPRATDMPQLRAVQWAFKGILLLSGVRVNVIGEENVPTDEPVLYICNHRSFYDVIITYIRCPRPTGYIAKMSIKKVPILRTYMERLHCLFIDRDDLKQSLKVILAAISEVKNGVSICIFPEGTRNKDFAHPESMGEFKEGSFKIATKTGCKIIPMALIGTDQILEAHFPWVKPNRVTLVYGTPIDPKSLSKEDQKHIGAYVQNVIQQMLNEQLGISEK